MNPSTIDIFATTLFAIALIHTFMVKKFQHLAFQYPKGTPQERLFHLLGEVEVVFGLWAGILIFSLHFLDGREHTVHYMEKLNFTEPAFVFTIMTIAATRPILQFATRSLKFISRKIPLKGSLSYYLTVLTLGPLLGSFITEPAAMTVTALILRDEFYELRISDRLKYMTIGLLFVNVSIGGTLTHFAAPPVLMVASKWNWDSLFMMTHFGWKSFTAVLVSTCAVAYYNRDELIRLADRKRPDKPRVRRAPFYVVLIHLLFLLMVVMNAHHMVLFLGLLLFFLGVVTVFRDHNDPLKLRESLLVGFFLGGLVILGGFQRWWLEATLTSLNSLTLFLGATGLTAVTDNAALTYLGSQVQGLSELAKYALVGGAVAGGGLTVIANAPNPAGYGILNSSFGKEGIDPIKLFLNALVPTLIAMTCLWLLPS